MADYGNMRKKLLMATSIAGSLLTISVSFFTSPSLYWMIGILIVLTNVLYGSSIVFYNAFLPLLVKSHPEFTEASSEKKLEVEESLNNSFSTRGFIMGYSSGVFLLLVSVPVVLLMSRSVQVPFECEEYKTIETDATPGYRLSIALAGIFWFCVSFFTFIWLKPRPGPPLPPGTNYLRVSLLSLKSTMKHLKQLPNTLKFLLAYFIYSDGYSTVASVGILFANEDMQASTVTLLLMIIEVPLSALLGNVFWLWLKKRLGYETKTAIVINCCLFLLLPIYGLMGLLPVPFGLKYEWELHIFAVVYGFNLGSIQSFSRALMSTLTPPGHESEFFGFFEISDKGSSWVGPLVVAAIVEITGKLRWGLVYLLIAFIVPIPILLKSVSVSQGVQDVKEFSKVMNEEILHADNTIEQNMEELKYDNI
jgi:UMF1 family MFS transporter